MRWAVALMSAGASAGCASPLFADAWLDAHDAALVGESIAVRFELTNAHPTEDLEAHSHEFELRAGRPPYPCADRASGWDILDERGREEHAIATPGRSLEGYLLFPACATVAGPYSLVWDDGEEGRKTARDAVELRPLEADPPLDAVDALARALNESARLG